MKWFLTLCMIVILFVPDSGCGQSLRGFADIHNHQFANLAFGGLIVFGDAYGSIEEALSSGADADIFRHGPFHNGDFAASVMSARGLQMQYYSNQGYPAFDGWPSFRGFNHQKVFQDWLYRAVQGGLRLMVMLAVDSPALCRSVRNDGRDCDAEMATIDRQIDAAYAMQDFIDSQSGGRALGRISGWSGSPPSGLSVTKDSRRGGPGVPCRNARESWTVCGCVGS